MLTAGQFAQCQALDESPEHVYVIVTICMCFIKNAISDTWFLICPFIILNLIKGQTLCSLCGTLMKLVFHNPTTKRSC